MKIAVIACNGRVAQLVIKEAQSRGIEVTGFAREKNKSHAKSFVEKDANVLTKEDLKGFDVVVDAVGGWTAETIPNITSAMTHLADILSGTETRLLASSAGEEGAGNPPLFADSGLLQEEPYCRRTYSFLSRRTRDSHDERPRFPLG